MLLCFFWHSFQLLHAVLRGVVYGCGDLLTSVLHLVYNEEFSLSGDFIAVIFVWKLRYSFFAHHFLSHFLLCLNLNSDLLQLLTLLNH